MIRRRTISFLVSTAVVFVLAAISLPADERTPVPAEAASPEYDLSRTGIAWREGLESALHRKKPVLLFQLLGEFDKVHC